MEVKQVGSETPGAVDNEELSSKGDYDLHIKVAREMQQVLKDSATLAYKMELIETATLGDLMNLYIVWGMAILKKKWLDLLGYQ